MIESYTDTDTTGARFFTAQQLCFGDACEKSTSKRQANAYLCVLRGVMAEARAPSHILRVVSRWLKHKPLLGWWW